MAPELVSAIRHATVSSTSKLTQKTRETFGVCIAMWLPKPCRSTQHDTDDGSNFCAELLDIVGSTEFGHRWKELCSEMPRSLGYHVDYPLRILRYSIGIQIVFNRYYAHLRAAFISWMARCSTYPIRSVLWSFQLCRSEGDMKSKPLRSQHSQNNVLNERPCQNHSEKCHVRILVSGPKVSLHLGFLGK